MENVLVDGKKYDLGATVATYVADGDYFNLGNCFVWRYDTIYKNWKVEVSA